MEPEQTPIETEQEDKFADLKKVTPLSKYLAMVLFIIMPFIGGWLGYNYAPEKVVERVVFVQNETVADNGEVSEPSPLDDRQVMSESSNTNTISDLLTDTAALLPVEFSVPTPEDFEWMSNLDGEHQETVVAGLMIQATTTLAGSDTDVHFQIETKLYNDLISNQDFTEDLYNAAGGPGGDQSGFKRPADNTVCLVRNFYHETYKMMIYCGEFTGVEVVP